MSVTLHQMWFSQDPIPDRYCEYAASWRRCNPQWTFRLWCQGEMVIELAKRSSALLELFYAAKTWAQKADIARYFILYHHPGVNVYADMDTQCLKPFGQLIEHAWRENAVIAGIEEPHTQRLCPSIIIAQQHHGFMRELCGELSKGIDLSLDPDGTTGPVFFTKIADGHTVTRLPSHIFYPWLWWQKEKAGQYHPDSVACHYWDKNWESSRNK